MWTLSSNDPSDATWTSRLKLPLDKVWDDHTYRDARLRERVIPVVVLVHPMHERQRGLLLLGRAHLRHRPDEEQGCVDCKEFNISWSPHKTCSSRLVHAWQLPVKLTKIRVKEIEFVFRWNSVEDFHNKAAMIKSLFEQHVSGM
uniref:Uncharacterized protein n=1 Tax=Aegilops tauschii TaxID=37682 RepID=M8C2Z2_AEGTA